MLRNIWGIAIGNFWDSSGFCTPTIQSGHNCFLGNFRGHVKKCETSMSKYEVWIHESCGLKWQYECD